MFLFIRCRVTLHVYVCPFRAAVERMWGNTLIVKIVWTTFANYPTFPSAGEDKWEKSRKGEGKNRISETLFVCL